MNESALRYRIYKVLLESDLTQHQKEVLMEAGWIDNLKAWAGAVKDTGSLDISKVFADNKFKRRVKVAGDSISKELKDLTDIAEKAGIEKKAVLSMIGAILKGSGITADSLSAAESSTIGSSGGSGSGSSSSSQGQQLQPGRAANVDLGAAAGQPAAATPAGALVAAMAGEAAGVDGQQAVDKAKKDNVSFDKAYKALNNKVAEFSGEQPADVKKVIDWLLDNDKIVPKTSVTFGESITSRNVDNLIYEKWLKMAGVQDGLITEVNEESQSVLEYLFEEGPPGGRSRPAASGSGRKQPVKAKAPTAPAGNAADSAPAADASAPSAAATDGKDAAKDKKAATGKYKSLAALISKQIQLSPAAVNKILNSLVSKAKVKLAD